MSDPADYVLALLLDWLLKGLLIFVLALALDLLLRGASASLRHMIWAAGLTLSILLPILSSALPVLNAPFLSISFLTRPPAAQVDSAGAGGGLLLTAPRILLGVYLVGILLVLMWQLVGRIYASRLREHASPVANPEVLGVLSRLRSAQEIRGAVELLSSSMSRIPFSTGLVHPAIILPDGWRSWPRPVFESVLIHELGHIRRMDCLSRIAAQLGCCIHWINPLAWFGLRRVIMEQEVACDNLVVGSGAKPSTYAHSLIALAKTRHSGLLDAATGFGRRAELQSRLLEILKPRRSRTPLRARSVLAFAAGTVALTLPISALNVWKAPASEASTASMQRVDVPRTEFSHATPDNNIASKALQQSQFNKEYVARQIEKMKAAGEPEAKITAYVQKAKAKLADIERQNKLAQEKQRGAR